MVTKKERSEAGRTLAKAGSGKGGRARANVLTPEERSEIGRRAALARWNKADDAEQPNEAPAPEKAGPELPHSMFPGELTMGDVTFECHVLNDLRRVLTQREVVKVISGGRDSSNLSRYLERNPLYSPSMLAGRVIQFAIPGGNQRVHGYEAELLVEICDMYLRARDEGKLKRSQLGIAKMAEIVVRSCAKVGIIALIDEATGYQAVREKQALQVKLQAFIADEMQDWARMFPEEFWFELARLEGTRYSARHRPLRWGKYVMAFVYDAIDPDVGAQLRELNPDPHYRQNHHQWLRDFGRDKVNNQIYQVIAIMKLCGDMADFRRKFDHVFGKQLTFDGIDWLA